MNKTRNKRCRIAACLALLLLLCGLSSVSAASEEPSFDEHIAEQAQAVAANEALMQYFLQNGWVLEYPEYFGGCYIEEDILHIRLVSPTEQERDALCKILTSYEDAVLYEYGGYSQADLQEYADAIATALQQQGCAVTHWYADSVTGNIRIGVLPADIDSANGLVHEQQAYSGGSAAAEIVIEAGAYTLETNTPTVTGGDQLLIGTSYRSAGACGYYEGGNALVTCGHGNTTVGASVRLGGITVGGVSKVQYTNGGTGDYSIVQLNGAEMSHKIGDSIDGYITISGGTYLAPAVGTYIKKYGYKTGYSYGTVNATNVTVKPSPNIEIRGMTQATISKGDGSKPGDSGGPYLVGKAFCGVHHGNLLFDEKTVYFTPYSAIYNGNFTAIGRHNSASWIDAGSSTHSGYCKICKETVHERHSEYWDNIYGRCTRCGRTDPITVPFE